MVQAKLERGGALLPATPSSKGGSNLEGSAAFVVEISWRHVLLDARISGSKPLLLASPDRAIALLEPAGPPALVPLFPAGLAQLRAPVAKDSLLEP